MIVTTGSVTSRGMQYLEPNAFRLLIHATADRRPTVRASSTQHITIHFICDFRSIVIQSPRYCRMHPFCFFTSSIPGFPGPAIELNLSLRHTPCIAPHGLCRRALHIGMWPRHMGMATSVVETSEMSRFIPGGQLQEPAGIQE